MPFKFNDDKGKQYPHEPVKARWTVCVVFEVHCWGPAAKQTNLLKRIPENVYEIYIYNTEFLFLSNGGDY